MRELSVGIIGAGQGGTALIETMEDFDNIKIEGIADINPSAPGLKLAGQKGIKCFRDPKVMLKECEFDVVFEVTGDEELVRKLQDEIPHSTALVDARTASIMLTIIRDREDIYFRLNVINVHIPPLRERKEDIIALAEVYIREFNRKFY
jgi:hypothetical protein